MISPLIQHIRPALYEGMDEQIEKIFFDIIFRSTAEVIRDFTAQLKRTNEITNASTEPLRQALRSGRVQYYDGVFSGQFNAAISLSLRSIGASFDKSSRVYRINPGGTPNWVKSEATIYQSKAKEAHQLVLKGLDFTEDALDQMVDKYKVDADETVGEANDWWRTAAKKLEVSPELGPGARKRLADDYSTNMKLWIKKFSQDEIQKLRQTVEKNAQEGYRFDTLIDRIQSRYDVSQRKAKFLARQETSLFMSKFRQQRFTEAGYQSYTWSTSNDERVRHDHRHLNGKVFSYNHPPVVDRATGRTGNPGEDFNCRCVAIPKLDVMAEIGEAA